MLVVFMFLGFLVFIGMMAVVVAILGTVDKLVSPEDSLFNINPFYLLLAYIIGSCTFPLIIITKVLCHAYL